MTSRRSFLKALAILSMASTSGAASARLLTPPDAPKGRTRYVGPMQEHVCKDMRFEQEPTRLADGHRIVLTTMDDRTFTFVVLLAQKGELDDAAPRYRGEPKPGHACYRQLFKVERVEGDHHIELEALNVEMNVMDLKEVRLGELPNFQLPHITARWREVVYA